MSSGVEFHSTGTLVDRAIAYLEVGPAEPKVIATDVMGLRKTSDSVADRVVVALLGADPRVARLADGRWALVQAEVGSPRLDDCTFAVVDVETTGPTRRGVEKITEIGIVVVRGDSYDLVIDQLVNPQRYISKRVSDLTKITQQDVADQPTFAEIADRVAGELAGRVFVAHNVSFDWRFVSRELRRAQGIRLEGPKLCTAKLARRVLPGLKSRALDSVSSFLGIEIENRHRAGGDAVATAKVLLELLEKAKELGAVTLEDVQRLKGRGKRKKSALPRSMDEI